MFMKDNFLSFEENIRKLILRITYYKKNTNLKLKGILISFLLLIPCAFIIGWKEPISLLPIAIMTLIIGALLGFLIEKL